VAWFRRDVEGQDSACGRTSEFAVEAATFVGYLTYMAAATQAVVTLGTMGPLFGAAHMRTLYALVSSALDLMAQPRPAGLEQLHFLGEQQFVSAVRQLVLTPASLVQSAFLGLGEEARQLAAAWQRVLQAGVLEPRGLDERTEERRYQRRDEGVAQALAALEREQRRVCGLPSCGRQETHAAHFKLCAACKTVVYCSKEHQAAAWPAHMAACKAARKAAEAAKAAGPSGA
jgi:hypothetical protein